MDYKKTRIDKLKELCKASDLSTEGKKDDLIKRLVAHDFKKVKTLEFDTKVPSVETQLPKVGNKNIRYVKMKTDNLSRYLNAGVIYPLALEANEIYKRDNRKKDLFNIHEQFIPVFSNTHSLNPDEIFVEIVISNLEIQSNSASEGDLLCDAVPLSRINRILFSSTDTLKAFSASVSAFPDFFLPSHLLEIVKNEKVRSVREDDLYTTSKSPNNKLGDWKKILSRYDRLMGMFSFMKNVGIFYSEREDQYQQFTPTYFSAITMMNTSFERSNPKEQGLFRYILFPDELDDKNVQRVLFKHILSAINSDIEFSIPIAKGILEVIIGDRANLAYDTQDLIYTHQQLDRIQAHQGTYNNLLRNENVKKNFPLLALILLVQYPNKGRQHTDKQSVRILFINNEFGFSKSLSEFLMAILGMYYGYKTMVKDDSNLKLSDTYFTSLAEKQQSIKFKLDSKLDRVVIETVFNWSRERKVLRDGFDFLLTKNDQSGFEVKFKRIAAYDYHEKSVEMFSSKITIIERRSVLLTIEKEIERSYPSTFNPGSLLFAYLTNLGGLDRSLLTALLKMNRNRIDPEKIMDIIRIDRSNKL